ncbi:hypothetical protein [Mesorhizobium delmotii]|uniref:Uncharacterized protein n=1 Tax=Mesorhizobium delmotii TaxID=1631247 RepID=A0A2P9AKT0_9HYPH|nr:hypothetical protein [Mesorhizobium delmotii]SJM31758.1 exported hypothetical protein [Mesorhizobium delmotii]
MEKHLIAALAAVMGSSAMSAEAAEWSPTYLGCVFTESAFSATDDIYPDHRNEERLKVGSTKFELAFAAIDLLAHRAQLIGNQGSAQVIAQRGGFESVVFLEWTPLGSVNLTTVLAPTKDGTIRAVTSRHIAEPLSGYMASQYLGTCKDHIGELPMAAQ